MFPKNLTSQFPSSSFFKVIFECVEASCSIKLFWDFIPRTRSSEKDRAF